MPTNEIVAWLLSERGKETLARAVGTLDEGLDELTIIERFRSEGLDPSQTTLLTSCARARVRARSIDGLSDAMIFTSEALEQSSPPIASRWRARRFEGRNMVFDLCSGGGSDTAALADVTRVVALDSDELRVHLLRHNVGAARAVAGDALHPPFDLRGALVHADPARRASGARVFSLDRYQPPVGALTDVLRETAGACVLLAPGVDIDAHELRDAELEFIQIGRTLVECAAWFGSLKHGRLTATLLPSGETMSWTPSGERAPVGPIGAYLLRPEPAAARARLHEKLAVDAGARKIARRRAMLTSDEKPPASPWWTRWHVEAIAPFRAKKMKEWLRSAEESPLEIEVIGTRIDVEKLWQQLGPTARGPQGRRAFVIALDDEVKAIFVRPVP